MHGSSSLFVAEGAGLGLLRGLLYNVLYGWWFRKTGNSMDPPNLKEEAHRLVDRLSDDASWDDLMREIYVRQAIESGLRDSEQGRVVSVEEVRAKFGLTPQ